MKTYLLRVTLPGYGRLWRTIEIREDQTLEALHDAIQQALGWDGAHLYSFFMSGQAWDSESEYCLPEDAVPHGFFEEEEEARIFEAFRQAQPPDAQGKGEAVPDPFDAAAEDALRSLIPHGVDIDMDDIRTRGHTLMAEFFAAGEEEEIRDVRRTTLDTLDLKPRKEFLYLFDYDEEWKFRVRVEGTGAAEPGVAYPRVVEAAGEAPPQYPGEDA